MTGRKEEHPPLNWEKVKRFLDEPGQRWITAYRNLNQSEQALLLAVLDAGDAQDEVRVREGYIARAASIERPLSWDRAVARLTHSFLVRTQSYTGELLIDFEHPSLRDIILMELSEDASARRTYISIASATGLAELIVGLAALSRDPHGSERFDIVRDDAEAEILVNRIGKVALQSLPIDQWQSLLSSALLLLPSRQPKDKTPVRSPRDRNERLSPSDANLHEFALSRNGRVAVSIANAFASATTLAANTNYRPRDWERLLDAFYTLAEYTDPPVGLKFARQLILQYAERSVTEIVPLVNSIALSEPMVLRQAVSDDILSRWDEQIDDVLSQLISRGREFQAFDPDESDYDENYEIWSQFTDWIGDAEAALEVESIYSWSSLIRDDRFDELVRLKQQVYVAEPPEPEQDRDDGDSVGERGAFDIDEMFKDL